MTDPHPHSAGHEPAETHDHDDHGHGHGHDAKPDFPIIPENSGADTILNAVAWLGLVVLLVFSIAMVSNAGRAAEAGEQHEAVPDSAVHEAR